jgi:deoxyadenosine/deoxycytidine kinase
MQTSSEAGITKLARPFKATTESNVGAGKSTFGRVFKELHGDDCEFFPEEVNRKLLAKFYGDTKRYAFTMQWGQLQKRLANHRVVDIIAKHVDLPTPRFVLYDRSILGDYVFMLKNYLDGRITADEASIYESELRVTNGYSEFVASQRYVGTFDAIIFVDADPQECKYRLEGVRKHEEENGIEMAYYIGLDRIHFCLMLDIIAAGVGKCFVYRSPGTNDPKRIDEFMVGLEKHQLPSAQVTYDDLPEHINPSQKAKDVLYLSLSVYSETQTSSKKALSAIADCYACNTVYVPVGSTQSNNLQSSSSSSSSSPTHPVTDAPPTRGDVYVECTHAVLNDVNYNDQRYPTIKAYNNAFIRLIYQQLREGKHVHLFSRDGTGH